MTLARRALVIDDEKDIRELLSLTLGRMGLSVSTAGDVASAKAQLEEHRFDICITDMRLPDGTGLDIVSHIATHFSDLPVAMITAFGNVETAVAALKAGAFDFVAKPVDLNALRSLVNHALNIGLQRRRSDSVSSNLGGQSPSILQLQKHISKMARNQAPLLIFGESGVGKERIARAIHMQSSRKEAPFVTVHCGAIAPDQFDPHLFGGGKFDSESQIARANGGTVYFEEIDRLPLGTQVKLLRTLQDRTLKIPGQSEDIALDVRVISSSTENLAAKAESGKFRQDLFYRLCVLELNVPALRERKEDIADLAQSLLQKFADRDAQTAVPLSDDALEALRQYDFPGNVRELENILERAIAIAEGGVIDPEHLRLQDPLKSLSSGALAVDLSANGDTTALPEAMDNIERETIRKALDANKWNRTKTAAALGITFRALRYKLKKLGLDD